VPYHSHFWKSTQRRNARLRTRVLKSLDGLALFDRIVHHEYLLSTYKDMRQNNGHAAGLDGLTFAHLGPREVNDLMRGLAHALRRDLYHPQRYRPHRIEKKGRPGEYRELHIPALLDRVVAGSINSVLTPIWDAIFLPFSFGFRPGRSCWNVLAQLTVQIELESRYVLAVQDIANAFPSVSLDLLMADHRRAFSSRRLLRLINTVMRGHEGARRTVGIDQGNPYSPTCLNVLLHYAHDSLLHRMANGPPLYRYADNDFFLCKSMSEAGDIVDFTARLLAKTGLALKNEGAGCFDLRSEIAPDVLGFSVRMPDGKVQFGLGETAIPSLRQELLDAHKKPNAQRFAQHVVKGWIGYYGPAYRSEMIRPTEIDDLVGLVGACGFPGVVSADELWGWWLWSWRRWRVLLEQTQKGFGVEPRYSLALPA
jgi:hypothetical protein